MIGRKFFGLAALAAGLAAAPAASIVYDVPADAELVAQSSLIVYGRVEYTAPAPSGDFTDATVRIERVLKGSVPGSTVVVRQEGGRGVVVMGLPMLRKGDRVLLLLDAGQGGMHRTVEMGLGIFFEDRGHLARHDVPDDGFRHAERFGRWIEDAEAGLARPADYRVEEIPGPRRVRQEANWLTVPEGDCWRDEAGAGKLMRWAQWDSGFSRIQAPGEACCDEAVLSTKVKVTSGGWTDQKALDMTNAAAALWNGDSGSNVNIPAAGIDNSHPWTRTNVRMQAVIGVEYGASMGYTLGTARAKHTYNGDEMPLFLDKRTNAAGDDVAVVMFDEDGASAHVSTNTYKCVKWGQRAGASAGGNPGDALCSTHEGAYTPQGTVEEFMELVRVPRTNVNGYAVVHHECTLRFGDEYRTTRHSIPGGGGQAYRIAHATAFISEEAMGNANTILGVVAHEMGHTLGFDHPASGVQSIMGAHPVAGYTSLQADDRTAVRKLYPASSGGGSPPSGGGSPPPSGGGGAPEPEPEPEPPPPSPPPPPPPPPVPPVAEFTVDMPCDDGLCRARTGEDVTFTDTSSGTVSRRSWDFETMGRGPSGQTVSHGWSSPGFYRATLTVEGADVESTASRMFRVKAGEPAGACAPDAETVCLQDSRYQVAVEWQHPDGALHAANVVHAGTNDSGLFSFHDRDNWEMLVKVLNGCAINGHHWVYAASATDLGYAMRVTDTATGEMREFTNESGQVASAVLDAEAFSTDCQPPAVQADWRALAGGETLLLDDGRFEVTVEWSTEEDGGAGRTVRRGTEDSGLFWFFEPGNWEVLVKVLDGCGINGHHWVYAASATSLPFEMAVTDTETGEVYRYSKGADDPVALADPAAFTDSCRAGR